MPSIRNTAKANGRARLGEAPTRGRGARLLSTTASPAWCGAWKASAGFRLNEFCTVRARESVFAQTHGHARRGDVAALNRLDPSAADRGNREQEPWDRQSHGEWYTPEPNGAGTYRAAP